MNPTSQPEKCFCFHLTLPNAIGITIQIPRNNLKQILVSLGERDYIPAKIVEMLLLLLGLEEA